METTKGITLNFKTYKPQRLWTETHSRLTELSAAQGKTKVQMLDDLVWQAWKAEFEPEDSNV